MQTGRLPTSLNTPEMTCTNFQSEGHRGAEPLYGSNSYLNVNDMYFESPSWNSYEQLPHDSFYSYEASLLPPPLPPLLDKREHIPRAWGGSGSSSAPFLSGSEGPFSYTPALSSPAGSSLYSGDSEGTTPSPILLNEFTNVFDSDFALARRHSYAVPEPHPSPPLASIARRRYSHCSPSRSPGHLSSPHHSLKSREPSPTSSDSDPKRRFPCQVPGCSRRFTSQYTLKVHTEAHKPKPRASFPCTLGCPESFSRQHDRLRHEVAKHGKVCEFLCAECGRFFSSSKTLGNHKCPVAQGQTRWVHH